MRLNCFITAALFLLPAACFSKTIVNFGTGQGLCFTDVSLDSRYSIRTIKNPNSYFANLGIGGQIRNIRITTGLEFFSTGFDKEFSHEHLRTKHNNIQIPILFALGVKLAPHIKLWPALGAGLMYTYSGPNHTDDMLPDLDPWDDLVAPNNIAITGIAKLPVEIDLGKNAGLYAGPSLRYSKDNLKTSTYLVTFELGINKRF